MQLWHSLHGMTLPHVTRNVTQNTRPSFAFREESGNETTTNYARRKNCQHNSLILPKGTQPFCFWLLEPSPQIAFLEVVLSVWSHVTSMIILPTHKHSMFFGGNAISTFIEHLIKIPRSVCADLAILSMILFVINKGVSSHQRGRARCSLELRQHCWYLGILPGP